jgi:hypothetical protein
VKEEVKGDSKTKGGKEDIKPRKSMLKTGAGREVKEVHRKEEG